MSDLAQFLKSELFEKWQTDRRSIEEKWQRNEDAFKGASTAIWKSGEGKGWRSNTFVMMSKIKVISAYSMVIDMILQGGVLPFALAPSPWDGIVMEDLPPDQQEAIQDQIDDMTGLIHQQVLDCNGDRETMKCVMGCAKLGETYWRSYVHDVLRKGFKAGNAADPNVQNRQQYDRFEYYETEITAPAFEYVSAWDMFRDLETDDMQKSRGYCHREYVSPYDLRELKGERFYFDDAIDRVIRNYSSATTIGRKENIKPGLRTIQNRYNTIQKLTFWCRAPRRIVEAFEKDHPEDPDGIDRLGQDVEEDQDPGQNDDDITLNDDSTADLITTPENDGDEIEVGVVMAEDEVIRLIRVKPNTRPHGRVVWEFDIDGNAGIGVTDNVESIQTSLNGMVRAFEDNKKLSANVMAAIKKSMLIDWDGEFEPGTCVEISDEAKSAADAIQQIIIQDVGQALLAGIGLMERYADEVSMLPKIMQGAIHDKQKADTLGEINILQANAGKYLGSVIKNFDEGMIEPIVWRFYEYNMMDPGVVKGKGNYIAKPLGFSGFQNKIVRLHKIMQALQLVISTPAIAQETRLKALLEEVFKGLDIDPQQVFKTREEKEADQKAMAQAQQQALDQQAMLMLAEFKAKAESEVKTIQAEHQVKLEQMNVDHRNKLEVLEAESENRIIEKKVAPPAVPMVQDQGPQKPKAKKNQL